MQVANFDPNADQKHQLVRQVYQTIQQNKMLNTDQRHALLDVINGAPSHDIGVTSGGSSLGKILAGTLAAVGAPILLNLLAPGTDLSTKALSMPIAAYGGVSLYDILAGTSPKFTAAYPIK